MNPKHQRLAARLIALSLVLILSAVPADVRSAAGLPPVLYAKPGGMTSGDCSDWDHACELRFVLGSVAVSDQQIWVAAGTYTATDTTDRALSFVMKSGVGIYGGFAGTETDINQRDPKANITILSGEIGVAGTADNSYHVVTANFVDSTAVLDGFTVTAGNANASIYDKGGGMWNTQSGPDPGPGPSSPTLTNVTFSDNSAAYAGGGMANQGSPSLTNVTFSDNSAALGAGMYNAGGPTTLANVAFSGNSADYWGGGLYNTSLTNPGLTNVTFSDNSAQDGGGMYDSGSSPTLTNVSFIGNTASSGRGGGIYNGIFSEQNSNPILINVTFSGNSAGTGGGMYNNEGSSPVIKDSIFWGDGTEIVAGPVGTNTPHIYDSLIQGGCPAGATCSGTILNADPLLGPLADNGGFTETMALSLGSPAIDAGNDTTCAETDQRGVSRPQGPHCDMGAYEAEIGTVLYVSPGGLTTGVCEKWVYACELRYALSGAVSGQQIWAAAGTYTPTATGDRSISFELKDGVGIYGGFAGTETALTQRDPEANVSILSGEINNPAFADDNSFHVVISSIGAPAVLDGFTITGGWGVDDPAAAVGGGMYIMAGSLASPTLANLIFTGNSSGSGGGLANYAGYPPSGLTLTNVTFSNNSAVGSGGGIFNFGSYLTFTDVTFSGNQASNRGGGLYNDAYQGSTLANVTFAGNTAETGGGMALYSSGTVSLTNVTFSGNSVSGLGGGMVYNSSSGPNLTNVTFSNNSAEYGGGMSGYGSSPSLKFVTFSGNSAGTNGGGMYNDVNNPTLTNATFRDNTATGAGGGMYNVGSNPSLTNVTFSGNTAYEGGAVWNGTGHGVSSPIIRNVTFNGNRAAFMGGAIANQPQAGDITSPLLGNVTFFDNSAQYGGAMYNEGTGGTVSPQLTNVTFAFNSADTGGAIFAGAEVAGTYASTLDNVILWGNTASASDPSIHRDAGASVTLNYSVVEGGCESIGGATCGTGNLDTDPMLGPLQPNGGFTETVALLPGSSAIDTGSDATCAAFPVSGVDQRGVSRPQGPQCDIGAYERVPLELPLVWQFPPDGGAACSKDPIGVTLALSDLTRSGSSFDPSRVTLTFNDVDVTREAEVTQTDSDPATHATLAYFPPFPLSPGHYSASFMYPTNGPSQTVVWRFTVVLCGLTAPQIPSPIDPLIPVPISPRDRGTP